MARHRKAYGCTFPRCYKRFGSKADWKRHENTQHFHLQSYRCSLRPKRHEECAQLFWRVEQYIAHLRDEHGEHEDSAITKEHLVKNRIGRNGQSQYWCGFCRKIIPLKKRGLEAWNERFDHIDFEHFRKGKTIGHWLPASGHTSKGAKRRRHRQKLRAKRAAAAARPQSGGGGAAAGKGDVESLHDDSDSVDSDGEYTECSSSSSDNEDSNCEDGIEGIRRPTQTVGGKSNSSNLPSSTTVTVEWSDDGDESPNIRNRPPHPKKRRSVHQDDIDRSGRQHQAVYCVNDPVPCHFLFLPSKYAHLIIDI
jgi:hypothetical protein